MSRLRLAPTAVLEVPRLCQYDPDARGRVRGRLGAPRAVCGGEDMKVKRTLCFQQRTYVLAETPVELPRKCRLVGLDLAVRKTLRTVKNDVKDLPSWAPSVIAAPHLP